MRRMKKMCYCLGMCVILGLCGGCKEEEAATLLEVREEDTKEEEPLEEASVVVYVCGAVERPGVYELPAGSRIYEALEAAGGMTEEAFEGYLNQACLLEDGEQLFVPTQEERNAQEPNAGSADGKINLNTATKEELMTLTGIGESKAESIIRYREENGRFQSIEDIMKIEGIKSGVFHKIKDHIVVR